MNETRKTTLLEELSLIISNDINSNTETRVSIIDDEDGTIYYPNNFNAREIVLQLDRSMLQSIVVRVDSKLDIKYIRIIKQKKKNLLLRTILGIILDYEDQEIPETIVLVVDGAEVMVDWAGNIIHCIPNDWLNRTVQCICTGVNVDGSGASLQIQI